MGTSLKCNIEIETERQETERQEDDKANDDEQDSEDIQTTSNGQLRSKKEDGEGRLGGDVIKIF